jgi:hypothetical protein
MIVFYCEIKWFFKLYICLIWSSLVAFIMELINTSVNVKWIRNAKTTLFITAHLTYSQIILIINNVH